MKKSIRILSKFLLGINSLLKKFKREKPAANKGNNEEQPEVKKAKLQKILEGVEKCPEVRLRMQEYEEMETLPESLDGIPPGTFFKEKLPQVAVQIVRKEDLSTEEVKAYILSSPPKYRTFKVTLVLVVNTWGPNIPNLRAERLTLEEFEAIPSVKDKAPSFIDDFCNSKVWAYPLYFRSQEGFLIMITSNEKGERTQHILKTEIVKIIKPFNPQELLEESLKN